MWLIIRCATVISWVVTDFGIILDHSLITLDAFGIILSWSTCYYFCLLFSLTMMAAKSINLLQLRIWCLLGFTEGIIRAKLSCYPLLLILFLKHPYWLCIIISMGILINFNFFFHPHKFQLVYCLQCKYYKRLTSIHMIMTWF